MPSFRDDFESIEEYNEIVQSARKKLWDSLDEDGRKVYFTRPKEMSYMEKKKIEHQKHLDENKYCDFDQVSEILNKVLSNGL